MIEITAHKAAQQALEEAHARLTEAAIQKSRLEERTLLLQDMHDGFGSQLVSARLMAETGLISASDLPVLLQECLADLHLVADTLGSPGQPLADLKA